MTLTRISLALAAAVGAAALTALPVMAQGGKKPDIAKAIAGDWEVGPGVVYSFGAEGEFSLMDEARGPIKGTYKLDAGTSPAKLDVHWQTAKIGEDWQKLPANLAMTWMTIAEVNDKGELRLGAMKLKEADREKKFGADVKVLKRAAAKEVAAPAPSAPSNPQPTAASPDASKPAPAEPSAAKNPLLEQLAGEWTAPNPKDKDHPVTFTFGADGSMVLDILGTPRKGTFKLDTSAKPIKVDMIMGDEGTFYSIVELTEKGELRVANMAQSEKDRPTKFDSAAGAKEGEAVTLVLKRKNAATGSAFANTPAAPPPMLATGAPMKPVELMPASKPAKTPDKTAAATPAKPADSAPAKPADSDTAKAEPAPAKPVPVDMKKGGSGERLVGGWLGMNRDQKPHGFDFESDGTFIFDSHGKRYQGTFVLDDTAKPAKLDLNMGKDGAFYTIIDFDNDGHLMMADPTDKKDERPQGFRGRPLTFNHRN